MRAKEFLFETILMEVSLEKLATQPAKGGTTLGAAIAAQLARNPALHLDAEDHIGALEVLAQADPTPNNTYTRWLSRIFLDPGSSFKVPEDNMQVKRDLEKYNKLAKSKKLEGPDGNIDNLKSLSDLYAVLNKFKETDVKSNREVKKQTKLEGADYIINEPGFKVLHTKTYEANCFYGNGTRWCTTGSDENEEEGRGMFDSYSADGPIYQVLVGEGTNQRKFQFHYESGQFMDEEDQEPGDSDIALLSKHPGWAEFLNMQIKKHYEPIYNEIKDLI